MVEWLRTRLRGIFRKKQVEKELDEELRFYLEKQIEQFIARGTTPEEARLEAIKDFGGVERAKEECRDARGGRWMEELWQDLRYSMRIFGKNPGFTLIAALTLSLGIGANTAIFSIVNAVLLRPFPYPAPERLVFLQEKAGTSVFAPAYLNYVDWREQNTVFDSMAAARPSESFNFTGQGEPERLQGQIVSASFLSTLGIKPILGRDFLAEEDRPEATPAVILSYGFWRRRFGEDIGVIGKQLTLNNRIFTVIGVTPPGFQFSTPAEVTTPIGLSAERFRLRGKDPGILTIGRLKPNMSQQQAETELNMIAARLEQQYPESNAGRRVQMTPLHETIVGNVRQPLLILLGSVGLVLLIACANVANLLLVRSSARRKEMAVRAALGAGRRRIIRQLLTESVLLAVVGAALGVCLALWGTSLITSQLPDGVPRLQQARVDATVLVFTLAVSLLTGLLFGLAPALQASRPNLTEELKEGDRGSSGRRQRLRSVLVVSEVALTLTLLIGAGLLVQSFRRLLQVDPGFNPRNLLTMQVSVNNSDGRQIANFFDQAVQKVQSLPGVKSAAVSNGLPLLGANQPGFFIEGRRRPEQGKEPGAVRYTVSPDYFQTLGIALIKGRLFTAEDTRESPPVVVIDEALARLQFQTEDPIGKRLTQALPNSPSYEIVGVVRHVEHYGLNVQGRNQAQFYLNFNQVPLESLPSQVRRINLLTRAEADPLSLTSAVRAQITALNKDQAVFNVLTMEQIVTQSVAARRFSMILLSIFAAIALALAGVGIYGMMSYAVSQRSREIGVRMALGAKAGDVLQLVIGDGMKMALLGVALGLVASFALTQTMKNLLFGVSATDPATFAVVALLLTMVAFLACYLPARRATRVDPVVTLRFE